MSFDRTRPYLGNRTVDANKNKCLSERDKPSAY